MEHLLNRFCEKFFIHTVSHTEVALNLFVSNASVSPRQHRKYLVLSADVAIVEIISNWNRYPILRWYGDLYMSSLTLSASTMRLELMYNLPMMRLEFTWSFLQCPQNWCAQCRKLHRISWNHFGPVLKPYAHKSATTSLRPVLGFLIFDWTDGEPMWETWPNW